MIVLTDLSDWSVEPLDSLVEAPHVKPRLTKPEHTSVEILAGLLPGADAGRVARAAAGDHDWAGLAVVDHADRSQYDVLLDLARDGRRLPGPLAAVALDGRGFHGNRGRPWRAHRGNLHLSCVIPVDLDATRHAVGVPALPVVAVGDALDRCAPDLPWRIKWVNDVTVGDAKLAGVISAAQSRGSRISSLVYGIGVNLAVAPPVPPTLFVPGVTCLHDRPESDAVDLGTLTGALLEALGRRLAQLQVAGPEPLTTAYRGRCGDLGRRVRIWAEGLPDTDDVQALPPPLAAGRVTALDDSLALHVEGCAGPLVGGRLSHHDLDGTASDPEEPAG